MGKTIVILCDGTSNEIETNRTNILRLFGCLERDRRQLVYYDPGVGTFGADNAVSYHWRKTVELWGLATGWGLNQNVMEAYRFLMTHYDDGRQSGSEPDKVYLFGFSRGAYTVRVLAGFIHVMGLMSRETINLLPYAYRAYLNIGLTSDEERLAHDNPADRVHAAFAEVRLHQRVLQSSPLPIHFMGLFDTVGSVIESTGRGFRLRTHAYTRRNPGVATVRHAVAIDEKRTMFSPQLFPPGGNYKPSFDAQAVDQDSLEVWFSGYHADIGGGLEEMKSGLAKISLEWMIDEARAKGLVFRDDVVRKIVHGEGDDRYIPPNPLAKPNDSMRSIWPLLEWVPRKIRWWDDQGGEHSKWILPRSRSRVIPEGAFLHPSVFTRQDTPHAYDQPNLPNSYSVIEETNPD